MRHLCREGVEWLEFDLLAEMPGLVHGVFFRSTEGPSLEGLSARSARAQQALGYAQVVSAQQVHGSEIAWVRAPEEKIGAADGLMTQLKAVGLMVMHADCQAAIFYDPIQRAVAVVHAGWRGLVQDIYGLCLKQMEACFGSNARDVCVGIGPSLGPEHAEFQQYQQEFPRAFWRFETHHQHFNLWEVGRWQLEQAGVLAHHIEIAQLCTYQDPQRWYSYRRDKLTGRNVTLAGLSA